MLASYKASMKDFKGLVLWKWGVGMVARRVSASGLLFWLNRLVAAGLPRSIFLGRFNGAMAQCVAPSFHSQRAARSAVLFSVCGDFQQWNGLSDDRPARNAMHSRCMWMGSREREI